MEMSGTGLTWKAVLDAQVRDHPERFECRVIDYYNIGTAFSRHLSRRGHGWEHVTPEDVTVFLRSRESRIASRGARCVILRRLLRWSHRAGIMRSNPVAIGIGVDMEAASPGQQSGRRSDIDARGRRSLSRAPYHGARSRDRAAG